MLLLPLLFLAAGIALLVATGRGWEGPKWAQGRAFLGFQRMTYRIAGGPREGYRLMGGGLVGSGGTRRAWGCGVGLWGARAVGPVGVGRQPSAVSGSAAGAWRGSGANQ